MMTFQPFLGQVRLAHRAMGQTLALADAYDNQISDLLSEARPLADASALFNVGNVCHAQVARLRRASDSDYSAEKADVEKCIADLQAKIKAAQAPATTPAAPAAAAVPAAAPSGVMLPNWVLVVGGVAIAGLLVHAVVE